MPQYEFGMPDRIQEILDALERSKSQPQQERLTSTDRVNDSVFQGADANKAAYIQQQQAAQQQQALQQQAPPQPQQIPPQPQQRPLSQLDVALANQIIGAKGNYDNADILAKAQAPQGADEAAIRAIADSIRNSAHGDAENTRKLAADAGVDLSPYDADVTAQDARFNLQSRQVKDIADLMSGQGKYARTADQFFNDEYLMLGSEGYSAREAKRIAGQRAQEYQAERLGYLRNAYNVHGRDGNYTNDIGVGILDAIAQENPAVAQVYATAYKLPTHAQTRYETLEDKNLQQMFDLQRGDQTFLHNLGLQGQTFNFNTILENLRSQLRREENQQDADLRLRNEAEADRRTALRKAMEEKPDEVKATYNEFFSAAKLKGLSDEEADIFSREMTFRKIVGGNGGGNRRSGNGKGNSDEPKYNDKQNTFLNQTANLFSMALEDLSNEEAINRYEAAVKGVDGVTGPESDKAVTMLDFPVGVRQEFEDRINALRGMHYKLRADDNKATEYWVKVRDVNLLEKLFPNENWDYYWELKGGKPKKTLGDKSK